MPRFTVELKVTLEVDIEIAPEKVRVMDMQGLHDDIAFQAEEVLTHHRLVSKIIDRTEDFTGWCVSAATLSAEAKQPSKKYFETLLQSDPN